MTTTQAHERIQAPPARAEHREIPDRRADERHRCHGLALSHRRVRYNNCTPKSKAHIAAGFTHAPDGKMMSINVEYIAGALFVQHYVEDISEKLRCRVKSTSTLLMNNAFTKVGVVWEVVVQPTQGDVHELRNNVWIYTTKEFEEFLEAAKMPYEEVAKGVQAAVDSHNAEEAPAIRCQYPAQGSKDGAAGRGVRKAVG